MRSLLGAFSVNFQNALSFCWVCELVGYKPRAAGCQPGTAKQDPALDETSLEEAEQRDGELQILDLSQQISSFTQANFQWVSAICNRNNLDSQGSQSSVLEHIRTRRAGL